MAKTIQKKGKKQWVSTVLLLLLLVAVDRASKVFAEAALAGKGTVPVIPGVLGLHLLEGGNTGAAFGLFSGNTLVLVVLTAVVIAALLYTLLFRKYHSGWLRFAAILVVAGGLGNLYDRVVYGRVTDFFEFLFVEFAVFNVADCFIDIGAVLALICLLCGRRDAPIFDGPDKPEASGQAENERPAGPQDDAG